MQPVSSRTRYAWGLILLAFSASSVAQSQSSQGQTSQNQSSQNQTSQNQSGQNQPASNSAGGQDSASADSGNSLAGAARSAKVQRASHAKKVFTDEDMEATDGPLPRLKMDGPENSDEVLAAISTYKLTHTSEQTEQAVHMWFDKYDQILAAAIQQNHEVAALRSANMSNGNALCQESQDYQHCASRQMAEQRGAQSDQQEYIKNSAAMMRIQQSFQKVRTGLQMSSLRYSWFKIRNMNNDMF
jgi:hypothetical protein